MKNKTILITGGATGIGLATAKLLNVEGAKIIVTGRNPETLAAVQRELPDVIVIKSDSGSLSAAQLLGKKSKNTLTTLTACSSMLALPRLPRLNRNRRNTSMTASTSMCAALFSPPVAVAAPRQSQCGRVQFVPRGFHRHSW